MGRQDVSRCWDVSLGNCHGHKSELRKKQHIIAAVAPENMMNGRVKLIVTQSKGISF